MSVRSITAPLVPHWFVRAATGGALIVAALGVVGLVAGSTSLLADRAITLVLPLASGPAATTIESSVDVVAARYDTVSVTVTGLSTWARSLLVADAAVQTALPVGLCLVVFTLGMHLLEQRPFARTATRAVLAAAVIVIVTGTLSALTGSLADAEVVAHLGDAAADELYLFRTQLDPAPIAWGVALAVVAGVFRIGERLQRDSEGLV